MKYPTFNKKNITIGVFAPSSGIGDRIERFNIIKSELEKRGYKLKLTNSVMNVNVVSNLPKERMNEFESLLKDEDVDVIFCARGGEFAIEIAPFLNFKLIKKYPKYVVGFSDSTIMTYLIMVGADVASITSYNFIDISRVLRHESFLNLLEMIDGKSVIQKKYDLYEENKNSDILALEKENKYLSNRNKIDVSGRVIGGTIDCLSDIIGMPYDKTWSFIDKYKDDGFIWYFDVFEMNSNDFYRTLLRMKHLHYFRNVKAVLMGKKRSYCEERDISYSDSLVKIFGDIPIIEDVDIGHVYPIVSMINGAVANINYNDGEFSILFTMIE